MNTNKATAAQINYARRLGEERGIVVRAEHLTKREASALIDKLLRTPKREDTVLGRENVTEGFYVIVTATERLAIKVQRAVHGSGRLYTKRWSKDEQAWVFLPRGIDYVARAGRKMTAEEAGELGRLYGICIACGAQLTDEDSIARGLGPICATKF